MHPQSNCARPWPEGTDLEDDDEAQDNGGRGDDMRGLAGRLRRRPLRPSRLGRAAAQPARLGRTKAYAETMGFTARLARLSTQPPARLARSSAQMAARRASPFTPYLSRSDRLPGRSGNNAIARLHRLPAQRTPPLAPDLSRTAGLSRRPGDDTFARLHRQAKAARRTFRRAADPGIEVSAAAQAARRVRSDLTLRPAALRTPLASSSVPAMSSSARKRSRS